VLLTRNLGRKMNAGLQIEKEFNAELKEVYRPAKSLKNKHVNMCRRAAERL